MTSGVLFIALVSIATFAIVTSVVISFSGDSAFEKRMKSIASERERIRAREREKLNRGALKASPKAYMKQIVEIFNLTKHLKTENSKEILSMAGFRGPQAEVAFLFFKLISPISFFLLTMIYLYFFVKGWAFSTQVLAAIASAYLGLKMPEIYIKNITQKRQQGMNRAFPDAIDLLLICVEAGMAMEPSMRKVAHEIGAQSIELAEEFALTTAELSYLPDRRMALENLANRTGLDSIKQVTTVLIQSERYGTALGEALRVVSAESRKSRMLLAEKKAAALGPKLTVPMMLFFLPVIFFVILTPAYIQSQGKF